jgi:hypothetical protein
MKKTYEEKVIEYQRKLQLARAKLRKEQTREKIVVGAIILKECEQKPELKKYILSKLMQLPEREQKRIRNLINRLSV